MTFPKARLVVSACLFLLWIGFLFYLVVDSPKVILSKPQMQTAPLLIVARVKSSAVRGEAKPSERVVVEKVLWSAREDGELLTGKELELPDLAECVAAQGYRGPGEYLLPLAALSSESYQLAPVPRLDFLARQSPSHGTIEAFGFFSHTIERRLPIAKAQAQFEEMKNAGHERVFLIAEELRIYPWTPEVQKQTQKLLSAIH